MYCRPLAMAISSGNGPCNAEGHVIAAVGNRADVIVIGAGPAGSVAARQLALSGRQVLLLDKKRFPRRKVCGACLNYSAVTLLDEIGLGGVLRDGDGPEIRRFELRADSRRLSLPLPSGRAISRAALFQ
mgnify:CR=1 FL=1